MAKYPNVTFDRVHTDGLIDVAEVIAQGESMAMPCHLSDLIDPRTTLRLGDILFMVRYKPSFWPLSKERHFRFLAVLSTDDKWDWLPYPEFKKLDYKNPPEILGSKNMPKKIATPVVPDGLNR